MDLSDLILISVDDHLVEPPDLFDGHIPAKYNDRAPQRGAHRRRRRRVGVRRQSIIPNIGLNAVAGRPKEEYGVEPTAFDEMRPGCFDVHERVKDMNAGGRARLDELPELPGFSGRLFSAAADKDLALAVLQAYNDWHIDEWCGAYPDRFIPMALIPSLGPGARRRGGPPRSRRRAATRSRSRRTPRRSGLPSFHDDYWDPLWRRAAATRTSCRPSTSARRASSSVTAPNAAGRRDDHAAADEHLPGRRRPALVAAIRSTSPTSSIALTEGGIGLDPVLPGAARPHLRRAPRSGPARTSTGAPERGVPGALPHLLHQRPVGVKLRARDRRRQHLLGDGLPALRLVVADPGEDLLASAAACTGPVSDDELEAIVWRNALRWYSWDPFAHRPAGALHGGVLRAEAAGHDVSEHSYDHGRYQRSQGIEMGRLAGRATA